MRNNIGMILVTFLTSPTLVVISSVQYFQVDRTCAVLEGKTIDWECILGPGALSEVEARGGNMLSCPTATKYEPCSRYVNVLLEQ